MIDYLEDLLEEETAVELTGALLAPVGRRTLPFWEEEEPPARERQRAEGGDVAEDPLPAREEEETRRAGRFSWAEGLEPARTGAAGLLTALTRTAWAAGVVRQQGRVLGTELPGEVPGPKGLDLETMDRAVQRDARRYDGGFPLY